MIAEIRGTVLDTDITHVIIDVHGIGYLVHTSTPGTVFMVGEEARFFTYLAVRETALDLYGFRTKEELEVFRLLIDLPKIGPKSAVQILGQADVALLLEAIKNDDAAYLSKMSGIGKKSADKIVAGLKEKCEALGLYDLRISDDTTESDLTRSHARDAIDALVALGYPQHDARKAIQKLPDDITNTNDVIREALKILSN